MKQKQLGGASSLGNGEMGSEPPFLQALVSRDGDVQNTYRGSGWYKMEGVLPALSKHDRHWNNTEAVVRASDLLDWTKEEWILRHYHIYIQHTAPLVVWAESADPTTALWLGTIESAMWRTYKFMYICNRMSIIFISNKWFKRCQKLLCKEDHSYSMFTQL